MPSYPILPQMCLFCSETLVQTGPNIPILASQISKSWPFKLVHIHLNFSSPLSSWLKSQIPAFSFFQKTRTPPLLFLRWSNSSLRILLNPRANPLILFHCIPALYFLQAIPSGSLYYTILQFPHWTAIPLPPPWLSISSRPFHLDHSIILFFSSLTELLYPCLLPCSLFPPGHSIWITLLYYSSVPSLNC